MWNTARTGSLSSKADGTDLEFPDLSGFLQLSALKFHGNSVRGDLGDLGRKLPSAAGTLKALAFHRNRYANNAESLLEGPLPVWLADFPDLTIQKQYEGVQEDESKIALSPLMEKTMSSNRYGCDTWDNYLLCVASIQAGISCETSSTVLGYYKAGGAQHCNDADITDTVAGCKAAASQLKMSFSKSVTDETSRPAGCFWDKNGAAYFNTALHVRHFGVWSGTGGICKSTNLCSAEYGGGRCHTCTGCAAGLDCGHKYGHPEGTCVFPASPVAAFGKNTTVLDLSNTRLRGSIPNLLWLLPDLQVLDLSGNPDLDPNQNWTWTLEAAKLTSLNLQGSNQLAPYGHPCGGHHDTQSCLVGSTCQTHCCSIEESLALASMAESEQKRACSHCDSAGDCYSALSFAGDWNSTLAFPEDVWKVKRYNKGELYLFPNVAHLDREDGSTKIQRGNTQLQRKNVVFKLLWSRGSSNSTSTDATPPANLVSAGEGVDPGAMSVTNEGASAILAVPQRVGNYTAWLIAVDQAPARRALEAGFPRTFDQVVLKTWEFSVTGKPDFEVLSFSRANEDASVAPDPEAALSVLECIVDTVCRVPPLAVEMYKGNKNMRHFSGDPNKIAFTLNNAPQGYVQSHCTRTRTRTIWWRRTARRCQSCQHREGIPSAATCCALLLLTQRSADDVIALKVSSSNQGQARFKLSRRQQ